MYNKNYIIKIQINCYLIILNIYIYINKYNIINCSINNNY